VKDIKKELFRLKVDFDIIQRCFCSEDEEKEIKMLEKNKQPLPGDIHTDDDDGNHYRFVNVNLSKEELDELLLLRQIKYLRTIKNCLMFFVSLIIILFICLLLLLLSAQQGS